MTGHFPEPLNAWLAHCVFGQSLREIAGPRNCEASTILRQVRVIEELEDDPGVSVLFQQTADQWEAWAEPFKASHVQNDVRAVLVAMQASGVVLTSARAMKVWALAKPGADGEPVVLRTVPEHLGQYLVLCRHVVLASDGSLLRYRITASGRSHLLALVANAERGHQPQEEVKPGPCPLDALARRKRADGDRWLSPELHQVGLSIRHDVQLICPGIRSVGALRLALESGELAHTSETDALDRLHRLNQLLWGDLLECVFGVAGHGESLERIEERLDLPARSGKAVLVIGLQRAAEIYDVNQLTAWVA